jgi:hypothetical protein
MLCRAWKLAYNVERESARGIILKNLRGAILFARADGNLGE